MADLKTVARQYWLEGANIVLLKGKEPLHKWSQWQTQRQTELNFEALPWSEADGFAIICGQQLHNELYVGAIDFDVKNLPQETIDKGKQVLKHLLITQIEETPSGGQHWIYFCHTKPKTVSVYHNECSLELLGEGKLCIMAPSVGYKRLNDNMPSTVQDLEAMFYEALLKAGVKIEKPQPKAWFDSQELSGKPYRGKDPPCISALLKGTSEGLRNEYGIRLCSYFINFKQYQPKTVREEILKSWNKLNTPELPWKELDVLVKSAVQGGYVYGCTDSILSRFCKKEECSFAQKEGKPVFDEETKAKARQILCDPALFFKLGTVFERGFYVNKINQPRFVIGESRNKRLAGMLLIGASKLGMTSLLKILGEPGTAKDTILRMWLELLPLKIVERSYFTSASLRYSNEMKDADLLYIPDSPALQGEMGRQFRFMRADDGGLCSEYALKDPATGEMVTKTVSLPVKAIATTSNALTFDTALESGMWTLKTNSSEELTRKVKEEKLKFRAGKHELLPEEDLKLWKCAFYILVTEDLPEQLPKVPFAEDLMVLLQSDRTESRRDPDKLCDLISLIAWIRRFQKPQNQRNEADFVDFYLALQLGLDAITQTINELDEKELKIFTAVKNAVQEDVTCRYVANETAIPYKTCYNYLEKMIQKGFMLKDKKQGRNIYSVFTGKEPKELLNLQGRNFESPKSLVEFILKSFGTFSLSHKSREGGYSFVDPITGEYVNVEFKDGIPSVKVKEGGCPIPVEKGRSCETSKETVLDLENKQKELLLPENRTVLGFSKEGENSNEQVIFSEREQEKSKILSPTAEERLTNPNLAFKQAVLSEKSLDYRLNEKQPIIRGEDWVVKCEGNKVTVKNGNVMFQCPFCKAQSKPMFFSSEHDLKLHVKAFHGGWPDYARYRK